MKYGKAKYSKGKYGRYDLPTDQGGALGQGVRYRIRTINSSKAVSHAIENKSTTFSTNNKPSMVRIRSDKSGFVRQQNAQIGGSVHKIRVKSISHGVESPWVESVVGTVRLKGV